MIAYVAHSGEFSVEHRVCYSVPYGVLTSIGLPASFPLSAYRCLMSITCRCKQRVDRTTDPLDPSAGGDEAMRSSDAADGESVTILYTTLQKLAFNHAVNLRSAGADVGLLRCLQADCRAAGASPELRDAAAELLLQLSTPNAASATPTCVLASPRKPQKIERGCLTLYVRVLSTRFGQRSVGAPGGGAAGWCCVLREQPCEAPGLGCCVGQGVSMAA